MNLAVNQATRVEIIQPDRTEPEKQEPGRLDNRDFTFGVSSVLRLLFVEIAAAMLKLKKCVGEYTLKQCPAIDPDELFDHKSWQFENRLIDLSSDMKNGESPNSLSNKAVLAIMWCFRWQIAVLTVLLIIEMVSRCSIPFVIEALLEYPQGRGQWLIGLLIVVLVIGVLFRHNNWRYGQYLNLRIRTMLVKTLYKKLMRLSTYHLKNFDLSKAITLVTSDLNSIELKMQYLFLAFTAPFTVIYSLVMLIVWNGEEGLVGFIYFIGMFAIHMIINNRIKPFTASRSRLSQQRIGVLKESLEGLRLLKIYSWQKFFSDMMAALKEQQTRTIFKRYLLLILERALSLSSSAVASVLIFITSYYVGNGKLEVAAVFATLQLFMLMRFNVMFFSQSGIDHYFQLKQMMARYLEILEIPETKMFNELGQQPHVLSQESPIVAKMSNVSLFRTPAKHIIEDINLQLKRGKKYCMTGKVAQGKSTFMYFLLKELPQYRGSASLTNSISCTEQTPFIVGGTIRDNILLGREFIDSKYREVLYETCLRDDLDLMEKDDQTMLQPDGDNLSGGQKARITLARALYQQADLYVFDDPLSACDEYVAVCIIERMFSGMLRNKTVMMMLSNSKFVECFNHVLTLTDIPGRDTASVHERDIHRRRSMHAREHPTSTATPLRPKKQKLPVEPDTVFSTYKKYIKQSGNPIHWVLVAVLFVGCEVMFSFYVWNLSLLHGDINEHVWIQTMLIALSLIFVYFLKYAYLVFVVCLTNRRMHDRLYSWLLNGKLAYFEQIERSDLISRFSNDVSVMDMSVPTVLCDAMQSPLYFLNLLIVVSIKVNQWAICVPFLLATIFLIYKGCNPTLQKSKSLDLKTKAKLITHFSVLVKGATQLRSFNLQQQQFNDLKNSIVSYYRANHLSNLLQRGFGFFVQSGTLIFSILGVLLTYFFSWDFQSGQELIYCIALSDYIQFGIRQIATLDSLMMSAQKLLSLENIPPEQHYQGVELPQNWPDQGRIEFKNVSMTYNNGREALTNVSFVMQPGKKMGCIGRTGAGKSSLLNALFRLEPISDGQVLLDDIDISMVPLSKLRKTFGIIPQTPFIFNGTLRQNIDPYEEFTDEQIVHLFKTIQLDNLTSQLNTKNVPLSTGQKQLICLCRCLLNNPKILILDEASASIDTETDRLIQQTLSSMFKGRTVFSIAHRMNSISDSDEILVVTDGKTQRVRIFNSYREAVAASHIE